MARALGLALFPDGFRFAVAEGSGKKHSIGAHGVGSWEPDSADPLKSLGKSIAREVKEAGAKFDQVVLAVPSQHAVLREVSLGFVDRDKICQILKSEIESALYHLAIEEVVADYLELPSERASATLLATALPKEDLAASLLVAEAAGFDPPIVDIDFGAFWTWVGEQPSFREEAAQAWLYIGPTQSLLLVSEAGELRAIRSLHLGWRLPTAQPTEVPDAEPTEVPDAEATPEDEESAEATTADPLLNPLFGGAGDFHEVGPLVDPAGWRSLASRFVNEIRRGLAAVQGGAVESIHLAGTPVPGLAAALPARLGIEATGDSGLDADDEELAELGSSRLKPTPDPVAAGAALRGIGVSHSPMDFRQEEYRFTRGFERIEGPLTVLLFGLIALFAVKCVVLFKQTEVLERDAGTLYERSVKHAERFNEQLGEGQEEWKIQAERVALLDIESNRRIFQLNDLVTKKLSAVNKLLGTEGIEQPPSCLEAWRLFFEAVRSTEGDLGRFIIENLEFTSKDKSTRSEAAVEVKFGVTFFGSAAESLRAFESLLAAIRAQDWLIDDVEGGEFKPADAPGLTKT